jgi:hypothetical protein
LLALVDKIDIMLAETIECISEDQVETAFVHLEISSKEIPVSVSFLLTWQMLKEIVAKLPKSKEFSQRHDLLYELVILYNISACYQR